MTGLKIIHFWFHYTHRIFVEGWKFMQKIGVFTIPEVDLYTSICSNRLLFWDQLLVRRKQLPFTTVYYFSIKCTYSVKKKKKCKCQRENRLKIKIRDFFFVEINTYWQILYIVNLTKWRLHKTCNYEYWRQHIFVNSCNSNEKYYYLSTWASQQR